jgi:hypothetical protein
MGEDYVELDVDGEVQSHWELQHLQHEDQHHHEQDVEKYEEV